MMKKAGIGQQGSALVYIFGLCLFLSAVLSFVSEKVKLNRILITSFEQEMILSQMAEDLTALAMDHLLQNTDYYDAPEHFKISKEKIAALASGYQATVEIRDEGSRFNPNNLPVAYWQAYFRHVPQVHERLVEWCFRPVDLSVRIATPIRNNYVLIPEELEQLLTDGDRRLFPSSSLTVFGPANYYLLDGEVFVSLLMRAGLKLSPLAVETVLERFNDQWGQFYNDHLDTLLSQLQLPELPPLEQLERLLTAEGSLNPNFIEPSYLRLLMPADEQREFSDLAVRQREQPFTSLEMFEDYLHNSQGVTISSVRLRHLFSVQSTVLGIKVLIADQDGDEVLLEVNTVVERGRAEEDPLTIIYRHKKWGTGKEVSADDG